MKRITIGIAILLTATLSAADRPPSPADARGVEAAIAAFDAALNARDIDAVMASLVTSDDLTLFLPVPYVPMRVDGGATARKAFEIFFHNLPKAAAFKVTRHQTIVQVHGDVALTYSFYNFYLNGGALPHTLLCRTTMVLARQPDGRWRILHVHSGTLPDVSDFLPK